MKKLLILFFLTLFTSAGILHADDSGKHLKQNANTDEPETQFIRDEDPLTDDHSALDSNPFANQEDSDFGVN